jgi:hypothetical protein
MTQPDVVMLLAAAAPEGGVADRTLIGFYLVYAVVAVGLVAYLAWSLQRNGAVFLDDVFEDDQIAGAVNRLLVIGFYLINLGFALLLFQLQPGDPDLVSAFNHLVVKLGTLLLSLGTLHLLNMAVFWRFRANRTGPRSLTPPVAAIGGRVPPPPPPAPLTASVPTTAPAEPRDHPQDAATRV